MCISAVSQDDHLGPSHPLHDNVQGTQVFLSDSEEDVTGDIPKEGEITSEVKLG